MANVNLKSLKFPGLSDTYVIPQVDNSLSQPGRPADAKKVGDEIADLKADLSHIGLSDDVNTSLLACFSHVAWVDAHGQDYYDALEAALYADSYPRITAVFDAGVNVIYTDDALDTLKQYLTIKYFATKDSAGTVIASNDYTLSGVLVEGTSTVLVDYNRNTTTFSVSGVIDFYNTWEWNWNTSDSGGLTWVNGSPGIGDSLSSNRIAINQNDSMSANRRVIITSRGISPYYGLQSHEALEYYPIPVPASANHVTITISPNSKYIICDIVRFIEDEQRYVYIKSIGAVVGTIDTDFTANAHAFVLLGSKQSAPDTTYVEDVTELSIVFSEV